MAFDPNHLRIRTEVRGVIGRNIWEYDTEDALAAVSAANYFANMADNTDSTTALGLNMGDVINVMRWPTLPNANARNAYGDGDNTGDVFTPAGNVTKLDAAPTEYYQIVVTAVDTTETSANYGNCTATDINATDAGL